MIVVSKAIYIPLFFCQRGRSSFKAICRTVLKSKLDTRSPCLVPFFLISDISLSSSVITVAFWFLYSFLQEADVVVIDVATLRIFDPQSSVRSPPPTVSRLRTRFGSVLAVPVSSFALCSVSPKKRTVRGSTFG